MELPLNKKFIDTSETLQYIMIDDILFKQYLHDTMTVNIVLLIMMTINAFINLVFGTIYYIKNLGLFASINSLFLLILLIVIDKIIKARYTKHKQILKQLYNIEE